jgi:hypothetical protein
MSRHDLRSPTPALLQDSVVAGAVVEDAQPGRGATLVPRRSLLLGLAAFAAGCGGGGSDAPVVPAVAPTLEISSNVPDVAEGRVTVRFEFSSEPAAFASGALPFTMSGGKTVAGSFSKVSATLYTVQIDPNANTQGVIQITVPAGAFTDVTGKAGNTTAYAFAQRFDTRVPDTEPRVDMAVNVTGLAAGPFTVTFTFNVDVGDSFVASDVIVTNAMAGALTKVSSTVYTMPVAPPSGTSGVCVIEVPTGAVTGLASGVTNARAWSIAVLYKT